MSDLPSINDLIGKKTENDTGQPANPVAQPAQAQQVTPPPPPSSEADKELQKKMTEIGQKEDEKRAMSLASTLGLPHIDLEKFPVSQVALKKIPLDTAKQQKVVCFYASGQQMRVGAVDPSTQEVKQIVTELQQTGVNVAVYVISELSLKKIIKLYDTLPKIVEHTSDISISAEELEQVKSSIKNIEDLQVAIKGANATKLVTYLMGAALGLGASDLHVEAEQEQVVARLRLDGILQDIAEIPKTSYRQLISRVKLISGLKINITENPQDGRFAVSLPSGEVDVRVSTLPTVYGESIVMRLLDQTKKALTIKDLGVRGEAFTMLEQQLSRPNGMIITTGPTGSGKTTTLYAAMRTLNNPDVKIITLEDPVEYKMEGINQSQIDKSKEYTFAKGLKSILRQDPDVCMVGEIRELETAEIAIQAALTGHLMLSTLHTNSAAGAIPRFLSMGVKPFLLAPALNVIIGQRLVRKLIPETRIPAELSSEQEQQIKEIIETMPEKAKQEAMSKEFTFYTAPKKEGDKSFGYKGRIGIYEVLVVDENIEQSILQGNVSEFDMEKLAVQNGMTTMVQDGILKALDGITSIDEVFRVIE